MLLFCFVVVQMLIGSYLLLYLLSVYFTGSPPSLSPPPPFLIKPPLIFMIGWFNFFLYLPEM